jgi:hypothetical protein
MEIASQFAFYVPCIFVGLARTCAVINRIEIQLPDIITHQRYLGSLPCEPQRCVNPITYDFSMISSEVSAPNQSASDKWRKKISSAIVNGPTDVQHSTQNLVFVTSIRLSPILANLFLLSVFWDD